MGGRTFYGRKSRGKEGETAISIWAGGGGLLCTNDSVQYMCRSASRMRGVGQNVFCVRNFAETDSTFQVKTYTEWIFGA